MKPEQNRSTSQTHVQTDFSFRESVSKMIHNYQNSICPPSFSQTHWNMCALCVHMLNKFVQKKKRWVLSEYELRRSKKVCFLIWELSYTELTINTSSSSISLFIQTWTRHTHTHTLILWSHSPPNVDFISSWCLSVILHTIWAEEDRRLNICSPCVQTHTRTHAALHMSLCSHLCCRSVTCELKLNPHHYLENNQAELEQRI